MGDLHIMNGQTSSIIACLGLMDGRPRLHDDQMAQYFVQLKGDDLVAGRLLVGLDPQAPVTETARNIVEGTRAWVAALKQMKH